MISFPGIKISGCPDKVASHGSHINYKLIFFNSRVHGQPCNSKHKINSVPLTIVASNYITITMLPVSIMHKFWANAQMIP